MQNYKEFFKGKKITVMGLGLLGRGVGDAAFLAECGAHLIVTDLKLREQLTTSVKVLEKLSARQGLDKIKFVFGKHQLEDFRNRDMVLKSAGVPLDSIYIKEARKNRISVEMSASLFAKLADIPMIAVTGARGKSTVTHLIDHILKTAGRKIILGGNVKSVSNLQLLKKVTGKEIAVFELDSWQLQGFGDNKISPHISVFTTFFPDHQSYYKNSMRNYFRDKANIFKYQKKGDVLVTGVQASSFIEKWQKENKTKIKSKIIVPKSELPKSWSLHIPGEHNVYNATLAVAVARELKIKDIVIKKALQSFKGVPGRLEFVRAVKGVKYYNDTTATTPEATVAALRALGQEGDIILIAGGSDKGLDMNILLKEIPQYCKGVILLSGTGTEQIKNKIKNSVETKSLKEAVFLARMVVQKGDTILLSPAFASFGMFQNEYDRGEQFMKIVKNLK